MAPPAPLRGRVMSVFTMAFIGSTPVAWDELEDPGLRPDRWTLRTILDRLAERGDLFEAALGLEQDLPPL
jgi:DNA primase